MSKRKVILEMSQKEFIDFFDMAYENAQSIGIGSSDDYIEMDFSKINKKRVKSINKMLKRNGLNHQIEF